MMAFGINFFFLLLHLPTINECQCSRLRNETHTAPWCQFGEFLFSLLTPLKVMLEKQGEVI